MLTYTALTYTEDAMQQLSAQLDVELVEFNGETDQLHPLVAYPPGVSYFCSRSTT